MTSNQIAYAKQREEQRHNYAMEAEAYRSDVAREVENRRANDLNYSASIYGAQASMYNAQLAHNASVYASQMNAQTQRYIRDQQTFMQNQELNNLMFNQDTVNAETHRHNLAMERTEMSKSSSNRISAVGNFLNNVSNVAKAAVAFLV